VSDLGEKPEAPKAIREVAELRMELARKDSICTRELISYSLNILSNRLPSDLNHSGDALKAIHESVELRRELTREHPKLCKLKLALGV
jgi:hypothetical protein